MSEINAKLVADFGNDKKVEFSVEWKEQWIEGDAAERLFFSDEFEPLGGCGEANLDVFLLADESVTSRVAFEGEAGELYSTRSLDVLLAKKADGAGTLAAKSVGMAQAAVESKSL